MGVLHDGEHAATPRTDYNISPTDQDCAQKVFRAQQTLNQAIDDARKAGLTVDIKVFHTELIGSPPADGVRVYVSRRIL
jgi:hypothetical protein